MRPVYRIGIGVMLIALHLYLGLQSIQDQSATYDEPVHLAAGVTYWMTGNYSMNGYHHPAFGEMWPALGALSLNPDLPVDHPAWTRQRWDAYDQYGFADVFLYQNRAPHDELLNRARMMQLILSVILGLALWTGGTKLISPLGGLLALGFWSVSPTFLAHGTLVTTDFPFAVFFFIFFMSLAFWRSWLGNSAAGVSLGLCLTSKYLAISLGPILMVLLAWAVVKKRGKHVMQELLNKENVGRAGLILIVAFIVMILVYQGQHFSHFFNGLKAVLTRSQAGRSSFFLGDHRNEGWLLYFPVAFLLKTPLPILISLIVAFGLWRQKQLTVSSLFILPPLLFFLLACASKVQIGHRHLLAVYPFVILMAAWGIGKLPNKKKWLGLALWVWMLGGTSFASPFYLSYFNLSVGGPKNGYRYFTDSNVDWGQGLKTLSQTLPEDDKKNGIFLSYFGVADPHAYGIRYISVGSDVITQRPDDRALAQALPRLFAISLTNYQRTYYSNKKVFEWLRDKEPVLQIAYSIFLYDFSHDTPARIRLANMAGLNVK